MKRPASASGGICGKASADWTELIDEGEGLAIEGRASGGYRATLAESARNQKLILSYKGEGLPYI